MAKNIQINLNKMLQTGGFDSKNIKIGVALSGGRDSIALAHALKSEGANIIAINIEHGIRGEQSVADSRFVEKFCADNDIEFLGFSVDAPAFCKSHGYTLEQGARILRYDIFERVLNEGKCDVIALAHHLDDQAETVFMRILRGTGTRGLCGMREVNGRYIRPLLQYTREDINCYIKENHLPYVDDETNLDTEYTRNFLRAEIARLKERFPNLCESIARLCKNACEDNDFIESLLPHLEKIDGEVWVNINDLSVASIAKRLVIKACNMLGVYQDIEDRHFSLIFDLASGENGKHIHLPHGVRVHKDGGYLVFACAVENKNETDCNKQNFVDDCNLNCRQNADENCKKVDCIQDECTVCLQDAEKPFAYGDDNDFGIKIERIDFEQYKNEQGEHIAHYIDVDKLPKSAVLRHRKTGDKIVKFGGGSKSLGDFLTDKKVPKRKRDSLVVIANDSDIYAIFGVEISALAKVDEKSVNIAKLTVLTL